MTDFSKIRETLQSYGILHDFSLHPRKAVCNNCGRTLEYKSINFATLMDYTTSEMLYCPHCGPHNADSIDELVK